MIRSFKELEEKASVLPPVKIAIALAEDENAVFLSKAAREKGLVERAVLTGEEDKIKAVLRRLEEPFDFYEFIHAEDEGMAAREAVRAVRDGRARILVKGMLKTVYYLKAILDREGGIAASGALSNITMLEMPTYHKLICVTDNAIIPLPTLEEKKCIALNAAPLMRALGIDRPKVAVLSAVEFVNPKIPSTSDAAALRSMSENGEMGRFIVEGPMSYDIAMSKAAPAGKRYAGSRVAGDPDILLMPNIEAANILAKSCKIHAAADSGGLVMGANAPVVLNSRSDDARRRLNSLMMAMMVDSAGRQAGPGNFRY